MARKAARKPRTASARKSTRTASAKQPNLKALILDLAAPELFSTKGDAPGFAQAHVWARVALDALRDLQGVAHGAKVVKEDGSCVDPDVTLLIALARMHESQVAVTLRVRQAGEAFLGLAPGFRVAGAPKVFGSAHHTVASLCALVLASTHAVAVRPGVDGWFELGDGFPEVRGVFLTAIAARRKDVRRWLSAHIGSLDLHAVHLGLANEFARANAAHVRAEAERKAATPAKPRRAPKITRERVMVAVHEKAVVGDPFKNHDDIGEFLGLTRETVSRRAGQDITRDGDGYRLTREGDTLLDGRIVDTALAATLGLGFAEKKNLV